MRARASLRSALSLKAGLLVCSLLVLLWEQNDMCHAGFGRFLGHETIFGLAVSVRAAALRHLSAHEQDIRRAKEGKGGLPEGRAGLSLGPCRIASYLLMISGPSCAPTRQTCTHAWLSSFKASKAVENALEIQSVNQPSMMNMLAHKYSMTDGRSDGGNHQRQGVTGGDCSLCSLCSCIDSPARSLLLLPELH